MRSRWRSVVLSHRRQRPPHSGASEPSPRTSMAGALGSTTNSGLRKLRRARIGDFRFRKRPTPSGREEYGDGSSLSVLLWTGRA
jgi:hypothetical protein